ncbi:hypothetical protein [Paenibacillus tundrae]
MIKINNNILRVILSFMLISVCIYGQSASAASTNEIYYLKGAAYSSDLQKQYSSTPTDIGSSAVVMSVSTAFDGRFQERNVLELGPEMQSWQIIIMQV